MNNTNTNENIDYANNILIHIELMQKLIENRFYTSVLDNILDNIFDYIYNQNEFNESDIKVTLSSIDLKFFKNTNITKKTQKQYENLECSICLQKYNIDERIVILKCKHVLHYNCAYNWLCKEKVTCPVCRYDQRLNVIQE